VKPTNFSSRPFLAIAASLVTSLVAPCVLAQGTPAPTEPANPWTAPSEPAPATSPSPATPAPPPSDASTPPAAEDDEDAVKPATPAPGLVYSSSQTGAAQARDQKRTDAETPEPDDGKLRHHQDHWVGTLGFRVAKISSEGFDPFADSDELAQFSVGLGRTIVTAGNLSLAGLFLYDVGGRSNEARGATTDLTVHRLTLGIEGRYHFIRQLFVFGRVAPGTIHSIAALEDVSTIVSNQSARNWVFATDLSAGAMFELTGFPGNQKKRRPNLWITFEGGYGIAGKSELSMTPDDDSGPERAEPIELGTLALNGPFMRGAFVLTY
jgi:hypothetical protein